MKVDASRMKAEPNSLEEWINVLCDHEMPIFSNTAQGVDNILNDERKGAMELASVILQDPSLTVKLLKISNSSYYNPFRQKMITVSRAIVILGSETIRELTLLCSFFEAILSSSNKRQANEEIAQAIHSAVQAKAIAVAAGDSSPEEIFIATLLNHIGKISFWCFCGEQGERIQALIEDGNCTREEAEKQVLGFKLSDLSVSLSKAWKLGGLIEEAIKKFPLSNSPRVGLVHLGYEITEALKDGADPQKYDACIKKVEAITKLSKKAVIGNIKNNANVAFDIARQFGALEASAFIQKSPDHSGSEIESIPILDKLQLQFQISQDITSLISDKLDINLLLETVLEGIQRGIGMDRTIFSILATDKQSLNEKLSLGWRKDIFNNKITFNISSIPPNLFFHALSSPRPFWAKPSTEAKLYTPRDINVIGKNQCFLMPIYSSKKPIGLIYSDRGISGAPLTDEDFNAFKHFAQQASIGLSMYRMQNAL